jgi:apurinic endonuclease APN1
MIIKKNEIKTKKNKEKQRNEKQSKLKVGCHTSISPSILDAMKYTVSLGASATQIFLGSNQSSSLKTKQSLTKQDKDEIKQYIKTHNLYVSIHAIYLLNFCSFPPTSGRIKYAQDNLIYDMNVGEQIGAKCVVLHIGVKKDLDRETAYKNMANNVLHILNKTKETAHNIRLLLETPAGSGTQIATTTPELAELYNLILKHSVDYGLSTKELKRRLGFCIDTAHIFSSGYAIRMPEGMNKYLDEFDKLIGLNKVGLIHLNDSKADLASHRDIHEGIGDGYIFGINKIKQSKSPIPITSGDYLQNLVTLLTRANKSGIPALVLETHKAGSPNVAGGELYAQEIGLINSLLEDPKWLSKGDNGKWKLDYHSMNYLNKGRSNKLFDKTKKIYISKKNNNKNNNKNKKTKTTKNYLDKFSGNFNSNNIPQANTFPTNVIIINKLKIIREYYQKIEKDAIRSLAYGKAIIALKNYPEEITYGNQLKGIKGIGPKIIKKVDEYLEGGEMKIFKERNVIAQLKQYNNKSDLMIGSIVGFGDKRVKGLGSKGIYTYQDLVKAHTAGKVTLNSKEEIGLRYHLDLIKKIPRLETETIFKKIVSVIKKNHLDKKYDLECEIAGSYPSGKMESKDIDILIFSNKIKSKEELKKDGGVVISNIVEALKEVGIILEVLSQGFGMLMCIISGGDGKTARHLDIRLLPKSAEVFGRLFFTSGGDFNQVMRQRAKELGMLLNETGLYFVNNGKFVFTEKELKKINEKDVFDKLDLSYIPMSRRR